ncbi:cytochrome-c peroxidase [Nitrincola sp. MINF-07-Sa-05]|uniref:cytochrome-c peroxidase n=1 Tax=Nitrincola salilacus TaxID=3400273 RepID=UPI003917DD41
MKKLMMLLTLLFAIGLVSAADDMRSMYERPESIPFPDDNSYSAVKATLGKMLFFDPRLSRDQNMNCASCHNPSFGWEAPLAKAVGAQAQPLRRHAPTILNMAWSGNALFWDGRAASLEEQAGGPIESPVEMNLPLYEAVSRLQKIEGYRHWFDQAFPDEGLNQNTIRKAIATFERTVVATEAPFDQWVKGDESSIDESAKRGFKLFNGKAQCVACHMGWNFTDNQFHDIGLPDMEDMGRYEITGRNKDMHHFKTPGLRNITQRAPYMHDGSLPTLESVIVHYMSGGVHRDSVSPLMQPFTLDEGEKADLIAFLETLTGPDMVVSLPNLPN